MSQNNTIRQIETKINEVLAKFKALSEELIECRSIQREREIRSQMVECEVKKKVLARKLKALQEQNIPEMAV